MRLLIIGSGGREHALAWKCSKSPKVESVFVMPGNAGTEQLNKVVNVEGNPMDFEKLTDWVKKNQVHMTIVGSETFLAAGIADAFQENGLSIFGPNAQEAQLESSKAFAKKIMKEQGISTAPFLMFTSYEEALLAVDTFGFPAVIKADGLAAGKGVVIAHTMEEAQKALKEMMLDKKFGDSGKTVLIEKYIHGIEASLLCFLDGESIVPMESAKDYKRIREEDSGPNTGGMGAISPHPCFDEKLNMQIETQILKPLAEGLKKEKLFYKGVIFIGLMLTKLGPQVIEFNVRFGDPETQAVLPRLKTDFLDILEAIDKKRLDHMKLNWEKKACVCVIAASKGYPEAYKKGFSIEGIEKCSLVFHSGTKRENGVTKTNGGRVLGTVGIGETPEKAKNNAYKNMELIEFEGMQFRRDIGK